MSTLVAGDRVWWKGEAWRITRIWPTNVPGEPLRADLESLERVELPRQRGAVTASVSVGDVEGRIGEDEK